VRPESWHEKYITRLQQNFKWRGLYSNGEHQWKRKVFQRGTDLGQAGESRRVGRAKINEAAAVGEKRNANAC